MNAPSIVREAISKERGLVPNSQRKPEYSIHTYIFWGGVITLCMLTGVALGLAVGK